MKLWHLTADGPRVQISWDSYDSFVIRAETEERAREIAQAKGADELHKPGQSKLWLHSDQSSCTELRHEGEELLIISSFNAG